MWSCELRNTFETCTHVMVCTTFGNELDNKDIAWLKGYRWNHIV